MAAETNMIEHPEQPDHGQSATVERTPPSLFRRITAIGSDPSDDSATKTRKTTLVITTVITALMVIPWGIVYVSLGIVWAGIIPLTYAASSGIGLVHFHVTRDDRFLRYEQVTLFLTLPVLVHITLGGFVNSSAVIIYAIVGVLGAMSYADTRRPGRWFTAFAVLVMAMVPLEATLRTWAPELSDTFVTIMFATNILTTSLLVFLLTLVYVRARDALAAELEDERERSERLLLNVLPPSIAERLKDGEQPIADRYDSVVVLFADIVDFTPLSESLSADDLVTGLNGLFSTFDELATAHGAEKVKTIGDSYMVISGAPEPGADVEAIARLALEMRDAAATARIGDRSSVAMRFGVDMGPAVAGVIGESKFIYDVYGDTVNMASRMESSGEANRIQMTERVASQLNGDFSIVERGTVDIKGKGSFVTYYLEAAAST